MRRFALRGSEWALVIFTTAIQLSVGTLVLLWALSLTLQSKSDRFFGLVLLGTTLVLALGTIFGALHLGNLANGWRALSNWRSSWLSREILLGGLFGGLATLLTALHWAGVGGNPLWLALGGAAALAGLGLVFGMSRLYMLRTVPAWKSVATVTSFFATAFLLGSLTLGAILAITSSATQVTVPELWLAALALLALAAQLITCASQAAGLGVLNGASTTGARLLAGELGQLFVSRLVLSSVGVGVFLLHPFRIVRAPAITVAALGVVLLSEVAGRYVFYQSRVRMGL